MKVKAIFWVVVICLALPLTGMGAGFHIREQGAKAMGMANAFVAQADDPSAVFYNPAGIAFQDGTAVSLGVTVVNVPETEFSGTTELGDRDTGLGIEQGGDTKARDDIFFPPNFYMTSSKADSPWAFGIGLGSLFPLAKRWDTTSPFRDEIKEIAIKPININPTVAYRIDAWDLAVAVGVNYTYADVWLEKSACTDTFALTAKGIPGFAASPGEQVIQMGELELEADGDGWGYNAGLLWKPSERISIGISYRSEIELDFDGDADYQLTATGSQLYGVPVYSTGAETEITLPDMWSFGIAVKPIEKLTVEFDADRFGWSSYESLDIYFDENTVLPDSLSSKDWNDVWAYRLGMQYEVTEAFDLRLGYTRDNNPIPNDTIGPELPDADRNNYTFGFGYKGERAVFDFAYMWVEFDDRDVDNNIQTGTYKSDAYLFAANLTYFF
ncbi:MAG: outer membrane protein transport protein [Desulfuromonadaceae bacterium]